MEGSVGRVCELCSDRGWVVDDDGGAGTARPCDCRSRDRVPRLLSAAAIPSRYQRCSLQNFGVSAADRRMADCLLQAKSISERYVEDFLAADGQFCRTGLLYVGPPGVGKTHLATAVLQELIRRFGVRGLFVDFTALLHEIQSTFGPESSSSKHDVLDPVVDAEVLVLDELGAQKPSAWTREILHLVMNRRYTSRLPTLFTTNYRLETAGGKSQSLDRVPRSEPHHLLETRISASLTSRLYEMAKVVEIEAEDFRKVVQRQRHLA